MEYKGYWHVDTQNSLAVTAISLGLADSYAGTRRL